MNIDRDHKLIVFDTCHDKRALALLKSNLEAVFSKDSLHAMLMQITTAFPDYFMRMSNESWMLKIRDIVSRKAQTKFSATRTSNSGPRCCATSMSRTPASRR